MATTGWTFNGKFYAYGSELPADLKEAIKARGLDEMGQPLKKEPQAPKGAQHPADGLVTNVPQSATAAAKSNVTKR